MTMWYVTCIICALILAWGLAYCGKNIATGLLGLAKALYDKGRK